MTTYFPIPFFAVLFFGYKWFNKSKMVKYEEMDFVTGCSEDIPDEEPEVKGVWGWLKANA